MRLGVIRCYYAVLDVIRFITCYRMLLMCYFVLLRVLPVIMCMLLDVSICY